MNNHIHRKGGYLPNPPARYSSKVDRPSSNLAIKIFMLLLLTGGFQVIGAAHSYEITLNVKNEPLESVMLKIRKQTGYSVVFSDSRISAKPLTVNIYKQPLEVALDIIFKDQPLSYLIREKAIIVLPKTEETVGKKKTEHPGSSLIARNLQENLTGSVVDSTGNALPGVTVAVKGSNKGTSTDQDGKFVLYNTPPTVTLLLSLIGFEAKEVPANGRNNITITLSTATSKLNEIVVKGYYNTTKELNTGSVVSIKAADLARSPVGDPIAALQGRVLGMNIMQNSGVVGSAFTIRIRGQNSIGNGNEPLYIIDGVPFTSNSLSILSGNSTRAGNEISPLNNLNLQDIERIDILKDADATAIYGSRGANGVVLITTKKGTAEGAKFDFSYYTGISSIRTSSNLLSTKDYLIMRREAIANSGRRPGPADYDVNGTWDTTRYTNWLKELYGKTATVNDGQLSYSGGNAYTRFLVSGGYRKETTMFRGDFKDRKVSLRSQISHRTKDNLFNFQFSAGYVNSNNEVPVLDIGYSYRLPPNAPALYDADGKLNWENETWSNPLAGLQGRTISNTRNLLSDLSASYQLLPELKVEVRLGYNDIQLNQRRKIPLSMSPPSNAGNSTRRYLTLGDNQIRTMIAEPQINYHKKLGNGSLDVILGGTYQRTTQELRETLASDFANDDLMDNPKAAGKVTFLQYRESQYRYLAFFGRVGYNYMDKYVINITARRDGSSRFGPGKRFGNFGSVGAAWIFSKEQFLKDQRVLSFGKIRASYGTTGNDQMGDYQYMSTYSVGSVDYQGVTTLGVSRLANPDFSWEEVKKLEFALELGFIQDRLMVRANYYRNRTGNQLVGYALPSITGFDIVQANLPAVIQNSGLELEVESRNWKGRNFSWSTAVNLSIPKNKLISFPGIEASSYRYQYSVGKPLSGSYVYQYDGLDPTTGLYTMVDVNGDGQIGIDEDAILHQFVGQKYYGGITNDFQYKNFFLNFLFQYVDQIQADPIYSESIGAMSNVGYEYFSQRWQTGKDNSGALYQKPMSRRAPSAAISNIGYSSASFIRLKNVSLGWTMPSAWTSRLKMDNLRLYAQAQNLITFSNYKGLDPETGLHAMPPIRIYSIGVQAKF